MPSDGWRYNNSAKLGAELDALTAADVGAPALPYVKSRVISDLMPMGSGLALSGIGNLAVVGESLRGSLGATLGISGRVGAGGTLIYFPDFVVFGNLPATELDAIDFMLSVQAWDTTGDNSYQLIATPNATNVSEYDLDPATLGVGTTAGSVFSSDPYTIHASQAGFYSVIVSASANWD
jgi:hypothetical protein